MKYLIFIFFVLSLAGICLAQFPQHENSNTLKMRDTDLQTAILKVSQFYQVDILYSDDLLKDKKVTCNIVDLRLEEALKSVLENSGIVFRSESESQIILHRKQNQNIDVSGWVLDASTGETLPYANISLIGTTRGTSANNQGRFALLDVPASSKLEANYIGYSSRQIVIDDTDLSPLLYLSLKPQTLETDPVIVTDKKWEMFNSGTMAGQMTLNTRNFDQLPVLAGRDILRGLTYIPGVDQQSNSSTVLNIRGGLPSENHVSLDGITLYHIDHAFGILSAIPTAIVKDVQLYKSNFPAKFGGKISAVVEMTGKTGDFQKAHVDFEANEMAAQGMVQLPVSKKATILLSGRHSLNTYLARDLYRVINDTPPFINDFVQTVDENNSVQNSSANISFLDSYGKLSVSPGRKDLINVSAFYSKDRMDADPGDLNTFSAREWSWSNAGLSTSWFRTWSKTIQSEVFFAHSKYKIRQDRAPVTSPLYRTPNQGSRVNNSIEDFSLCVDNQWSGLKDHLFSFGFQYKETKTDFNEWHPQFASVLSHGIESATSAFYIQDDWQFSERFFIRPALRITYFDLAGNYFYSPRFAVNFRIIDNLNLKASTGQYYQFVSNFGYEYPNYIGQLSWLVNDNTVLKPGKSRHITTGFNWDAGIFNLDIEAYLKNSQGMIEQNNIFIAVPQPTIIPSLIQQKTRSRGVDILLSKEAGNINGWFGYSFNNSDVEATQVASYPAAGEIPHSIKAITQYKTGPIVFSVAAYYSSGKTYSLPVVNQLNGDGAYVLTAPQRRNTERLSDNSRIDMSVNYHYTAPWYNINLGVSVYNLFDQNNTWYKSFNVENGQQVNRDIKKLGITPTFFLRFGI